MLKSIGTFVLTIMVCEALDKVDYAIKRKIRERKIK